MSDMVGHPREAPPSDCAASEQLVFVTGPSGAGRSTAVKALEDLGFEVIDNLPLSLVDRLLDGPPIGRPLALGIDVRNRDFSVQGLLQAIGELRTDRARNVQLLYLDCRSDVLIRRFSETRRRHPMAPVETPVLGIEREFDLLAPIRARANILIDTSELAPHELRSEIARVLDLDSGKGLAVSVQSFSYKRGIPRGVDMVFDCRFLRNPHWEPKLRALNGCAPEVARHVEEDQRFAGFFDRVTGLVELLLPAFAEEGKSHLSIAFGCTGGQHRSVVLAEKLVKVLAASGWQVSKRHREIERRAEGAPARDRKDEGQT